MWQIKGKYFKKPYCKEFSHYMDMQPTTFQIGKYKYILTLMPTDNQRGNGFLTVGEKRTEKDKYTDIWKELNVGEGKHLSKFSDVLSKQKRDGKVIEVREEGGKVKEELSKLLNGLNLLLDFEVARRLIEGDKFHDFPVITYIPYIIKNLRYFNDLLIERDIEYINTSGEKVKEKCSLVTQLEKEKREAAAKDFIKNPAYKETTPSEIRESLDSLHASDEDSEDGYEEKESVEE